MQASPQKKSWPLIVGVIVVILIIVAVAMVFFSNHASAPDYAPTANSSASGNTGNAATQNSIQGNVSASAEPTVNPIDGAYKNPF